MARSRIAFLLACCLAIACGDAADGETKDEPTPSAPQATGEGTTHGLTTEQAKQVIAKIGKHEITLGEFAARLADQSPYLRARYQSPERRKEFLENMVSFELMALEAEEMGLSDKPDVEHVRKQVMVQQMMTQLFDEQGIKLSDISDADIKAYYEQHADEFEKSAQVRASHIQLADRAAAEAVLKDLRARVRVAHEGDDMDVFREFADKHNEDEATKHRHGDLQFFAEKAGEEPTDPTVPGAVRKAAFALETVGDLHDSVVESEAGFHIVKLTGKRAALKRSLEDARRLIQNRLWRERREAAIEAFVADLRKKAKVEEDLALLEQVKVDLTAPPPPEPTGKDDE